MISFKDLKNKKTSLAVVGLGYVGLPLAVALSKHMNVIGFDVKSSRIKELKSGLDNTREVTSQKLKSAKITYTDKASDLSKASVIIIAVPTPIDEYRSPDLTPVVGATTTVGKNMSKGTVIVYESTVYPGLTEEICVPILEKESKLSFKKDFTIGYSPERINPGDKVHTLETITKIVSASDEKTRDLLADIYGSVVKAGIHKASSIKVAEAAKVIENTQRDLNIALMNELAIIFGRMDIDTIEVLEAAGSKWNFLPFRPGLVGGHCIGVDPYYLTFKAESLGFHPEVILAGRRTNDNMGKYIAESTIKRMIKSGKVISGAKIGILGFTFKENVPDLRNTKVIDVIHELEDYGVEVIVTDAEANAKEAKHEYGLTLHPLEKLKNLDALILAVAHSTYLKLTPNDLKKRFSNPKKALIIDVKSAFNPESIRKVGIDYWRL